MANPMEAATKAMEERVAGRPYDWPQLARVTIDAYLAAQRGNVPELVERLRNPAWRYDPGKRTLVLDAKTINADLKEAADTLEALGKDAP